MPRLTLGLRADGKLLAAGYHHESVFMDEPIRSMATFGRFRQVFVMADGSVRVHKKGSEIPPVALEGVRLWDPLTESVALQRYTPGGLPFCTAQAAAASFAVGMGHTLTLGEEGVITAEGVNELGQCDIHSVGSAVSVAAGPYHSAAIAPDGRLMLTGRNTDGECDSAALNRELEYRGAAASVSPTAAYAFRKVACGYRHTAALRTDGRVFAVGAGHDGRCDTHQWRRVTDIACGVRHTVAVTEQGTCLATGNNRYGQCDVTHFRGIVTVAAGEFHTVALRRDGRVLAAGDDRMGQCRVGDLQQIVSVACLPDATLCVRADGRVIIRGGSGIYDETIAALRDVVAIHACEYRIVALTADRRLIRIPEK
jgi:alpha-tubulin suppressor-like RCC1 family protein